MPAIKGGARQFREQIAHFLELDTPVAVTRRGETLGVFVPTPRKQTRSADLSELKAAADTDFFGTGIAVWTTSRIEIFLRAQVGANQPE